MTAAVDPVNQAYIEGQAAYAANLQAQTFMHIGGVVLGAALIVLLAFFAVMAWRERKCGRHMFDGRSDHVLIDNVWHSIYVRDVCSHCGEVRERNEGEVPAK